jgi:rhamnulokinase
MVILFLEQCAKSCRVAALVLAARTILEIRAMKCRQVLESLERLVGTTFQEIRVAGGGSQNDLLNQFTADATGGRVLAGHVEASALGNLAMQI